MMHRLSMMVLLTTLAACDRRAVPPALTGEVTRRDSAGVQLITYATGALAGAPRFRLGAPILSIGGPSADSLHDATYLGQALFVDDHRFVLVDGRVFRMVLFDTTGQVLAQQGRRGEGPGEFRSRPEPHLAADGSLWMLTSPARVLRFSPELELRTDLALPLEQVSDELLLPVRSGSALGIHRDNIVPVSATAPSQRSAEYLLRVGPTGTDTLASWRGMLWYPVASVEGGAPFVGYDKVEFGADPFAVVSGVELVIGTGDGWAFDVRDSSGVLRRQIRLHESREPVTVAMHDSVLAARRRALEQWRAPDAAMSAARARLDQIRFADSVTWYQGALADRDGSLWIAESLVPTSNVRRYAVFDSLGSLTRRVEMPARYLVLAADGERVLVRRLDPNGVGHVDLMRLLAVDH